MHDQYPSRFLFNAEKDNIEYVVPLPSELEEEARSVIQKTEDLETGRERTEEVSGKRVRHPVFGEGVVIGRPRNKEGIIVQFDSMVTPRTLGMGACLTWL